MAGPAERRKEPEQEEALIPIRIVPTRVVLSEDQIKALRAGLLRVNLEITSLKTYSESLEVREGRTPAKEVIYAECDRTKQTAIRMSLTSIPVLGVRYQDEVDLILRGVDEARRLADEGKLGQAVIAIDRAKRRLTHMSIVYERQMEIQLAGMPQSNIAGMRPAQANEAVLDALEAGLRDIGTSSEKRGLAIFEAARLYAISLRQGNAGRGSVEDQGRLVSWIDQRAKQSMRNEAYAKTDEDADKKALASFAQNLESMKAQVAAHNTKVLQSWSADLVLRMRDETDTELRKRMQALRDEISALLGKKQEVPEAQMTSVMARYFALTGRQQPRSREEETEALTAVAQDLRGNAATVKERTAEWFGAQALAALERGQTQAASLAISVGLLERQSKGRASAILQSYLEIISILDNKMDAPQGLLARLSAELAAATVSVQAGNIEAEFEKKGTPDKRERVVAAARQVKQRLAQGDLDGAKELLIMVATYADLLERHKWGDWAGSKKVEAAIDAELAGRHGAQMFGEGVTQNDFSASASQLRTLAREWGTGLAPQKKMVLEAADRVDELVGKGRLKEAEEALSMLAMYADCVQKMRAGGSLAPGFSAEAMESSLRSVIKGKPRSEVDGAFMASYNANQKAAVELEAARFEKLLASRPEGRERVEEALQVARRRAAEGDSAGAFLLLNHVSEYYGQAGRGKSEGWRYKMAGHAGKGFEEGRSMVLDAMTMETLADSPDAHVRAARAFEAATMRLADADSLRVNASLLKQRYMGEIPFMPGKPETKGRIPIGEEQYIDLDAIRRQDRLAGSALPGQTLAQLLSRLEGAAKSGDVRQYQLTSDEFMKRFGLVAAAATRRQAIDRLREDLGKMEAVISSMPGDYEYTRDDKAVLERQRIALLARLKRIESTTEPLSGPVKGEGRSVLDEYASFVHVLDSVRRKSSAALLISDQLRLNEQYVKAVSPSFGIMRDAAVDALGTANDHLKQAKAAVTRGDLELAAREYDQAMYYRTNALISCSAESTANLRDAMEAHRVRPGMDLRMFPGYAASQLMREFEPYQQMQQAAFRSIITGRESGENIQQMVRGAAMIEASIFAVPSDSPAAVFAAFRRPQQMVRDMVFRGGDLEQAQRIVENMQTTAENNQWKVNVALMGTGMAAMFLQPEAAPWIGPLVGTAMFTGLGLERVITEYRADGHVSAGAWVMLGLPIATFGIGQYAGMLRLAAASTANTMRAATLLRGSYLLTGTNVAIGAGMFSYMGYESYQLFRQAGEAERSGDAALASRMRRDAWLNAGMALFPLAHMGGSIAFRGFRGATPRVRVGMETEAAAEALSPARLGAEVEIRPTETPQTARLHELHTPRGLLAFLREFSAADAAARAAMLERLPESLSGRVQSLLDNPHVRRALTSGRDDELALASLRRAIRDMGPEGPGPGGPGGIRPETWRAAHDLTTLEGLRGFLWDLFNPDPSTAPSNARAAALAMLRALRESADPNQRQIAQNIDALLNDNSVMSDVRTGPHGNGTTSISAGKLYRAANAISDLLPKPVTEAAEAQAQVYYQQAVGAEHTGVIGGPGEAGPEAVRASGGGAGAGGGEPPRVVPGRTEGAGTAGAAEAGAAAGASRPGAPGAAGNWWDAPGWQKRPTETARQYQKRLKAEENRLAKLAKKKPAPAELPKDSNEVLRGKLKDTADALGPQPRTQAVQNADAANFARSAPERVRDIVLALHDRAYGRGASTALLESCNDTLLNLYSDPRLRSALERVAIENSRAGDNRLATVLGKLDALVRDRSKMGQMQPDTFLEARFDRFSRTGLSDNDIRLISDSLETQAVRRGAGYRGPLAATEAAFGTTISGAARAEMILRLQAESERAKPDERLIQPDTFLRVFNDSNRRIASNLAGFDPAGDPVAAALKAGIEKRGASFDATFLSTLKSDEVARAVDSAYGDAQGKAFRAAMGRANGVDEALIVLGQPIEVEGARPATLDARLQRFVSSVSTWGRATLDDDFILADRLGPKAGELAQGGGALGARNLSWGEYLDPFVRAAEATKDAAVSAGKWYAWGLGERGMAEFGTGYAPRRVRGAIRVGVQVGVWSLPVTAPLASYLIWKRLSDSRNTAEGVAYINYSFSGYKIVKPPSKEDDIWANSPPGRAFIASIPLLFPRFDNLGSEEGVRGELGRTTVIVDPSRVADVLADGRQMAEALPNINELLANRAKARQAGDRAALQEAESDLRKALEPLKLELSAVLALLERKGRSELDASDLPQLRLNDWVSASRGIAIPFNRYAAETFLEQCGVTFTRGDAQIEFLASHPNAFVFMFKSFQSGNLPKVYVGDAITTLLSTPDNTAEAAMAQTLRAKGVYLVPGIAADSFLDRLEAKMSEQDPGLRPRIEQILERDKNNAGVMAGFSSFVIGQVKYDKKGAVIGGEELYGDPNNLAGIIAANQKDPDAALRVARESGFVGPAILGATDSSLLQWRSGDNQLLVAFVNQHSTQGENKAGVLPWIEKHEGEMKPGALHLVLADLRAKCDPKFNPGAPTTPQEIEAYAGRQLERYVKAGWLGGKTPFEASRKETEAKKGAPESVRLESVPRKTATGIVALRRGAGGTEQQAEEVEQVQQPQLVYTAEARSFFDANASARAMVDGLVRKLFEGTAQRKPSPESQLMKSAFETPEKAFEPVRTGIFDLLTSDKFDERRTRQKIPKIDQTSTAPLDVALLPVLRSYVLELAKAQPKSADKGAK